MKEDEMSGAYSIHGRYAHKILVRKTEGHIPEDWRIVIPVCKI
jgi:hypothetical protein